MARWRYDTPRDSAKKCTMLCTSCPWNTTCPCSVQQMTGPSCVVPPAWVSLFLPFSPTSWGLPWPGMYLELRAYLRWSTLSGHGHGSHEDLLDSAPISVYVRKLERRKRKRCQREVCTGRWMIASKRVSASRRILRFTTIAVNLDKLINFYIKKM